jgi:hypothetical protein
LNSHGVEYLVVGAWALAFHGRPRFTGDLDLFVRATPENGARLELVLDTFSFRTLGLAGTDFTEPQRVIQLGVAPNRIDLLTSLTGVDFEEAWKSRVSTQIDGVPAEFIGREALIRNKRALGRLQDLADLETLEGT